ncbi:MAG: SUMF1/EgtB/PvdO family nonheme iron enzyme [Actinomycetota bacterium]
MRTNTRVWRSVMIAALLVLSACSSGDDGEDQVAEGDGDEVVEGPSIDIAAAELQIRAERNTVTVNGSDIDEGLVQTGASGDQIVVDQEGTAIITAVSVFEIEALRSADVTIPDMSADVLDVPLAVGHVFVRLNPEADAELVIDAGERQFITRSPDAEFALCQAPNGASCLAVINGEVEWSEDGVASEVYSAGQASFAARGNAPEPPRCADQGAIGAMRRELRSTDFEGALASIVDTWEPCDGETEPEIMEVALPSAARMERVVADTITVGSPDAAEDSEDLVAQKTIDGSADFYIEPLTVTNSEFRTWVATAAGDDADLWRSYAPADWIDRAPGGAATQAIYEQGTADEAVLGVDYATAEAFCASQAKRLATEVEWELAATAGIVEDLNDERQDWVTDWAAYGPGPDDAEGRQVLRGAGPTLAADPYYRVFAVADAEATAARRYARIRCAADEVAVGGRSFENEIFRDDFNALGWPIMDEETHELDYHPENYHLDLTERHRQLAVVQGLVEPISEGRYDVDLFIERNNTGVDQGGYRFGTVLGSSDELLTLTIQPDEFAGDRFTACVLPMQAELFAELNLDSPVYADPEGRWASVVFESHYGEDCVDAETSVDVPVTSIDNPVRLSLVMSGGDMEAWVNDVLVDTVSSPSGVDTYGFFSQIYHRPRTHIHYDDAILTTN